MRISDLSSDVCSSDLKHGLSPAEAAEGFTVMAMIKVDPAGALKALEAKADEIRQFLGEKLPDDLQKEVEDGTISEGRAKELAQARNHRAALANQVKAGTQAREADAAQAVSRSEEHTSELQSLMRISYAVFCLKKKK